MRAPKLSSKQIDKRNAHTENLREAGQELESAIEAYNDQLQLINAPFAGTIAEADLKGLVDEANGKLKVINKTLEAVVNKFNSTLKSAQQWAEGIADSASNWLERNGESMFAQEITADVEDYIKQWRDWAEGIELPKIEILSSIVLPKDDDDLELPERLEAINPAEDLDPLENLPEVSTDAEPEEDED